jgi:hypothetical protein
MICTPPHYNTTLHYTHPEEEEEEEEEAPGGPVECPLFAVRLSVESFRE